MRKRTSLLGGVGLGLAAGVAGTAVMTALREGTAYAKGKGGESFKEPRTWSEAHAPAQLAKRGARRADREAPGPLVTAAMHWAYGSALGAIYGAVQSRLRIHPFIHGTLFGTAVWGLSYAVLTPAGISEVPWRYPARESAADWS
ncbi:MAG TPA: hypothetical protein VJX91_06290, partial [Candidatus Eisenbacteria bacterium]|nr:hypothetical protein [Candidatus Eisenbacteria bacterium]